MSSNLLHRNLIRRYLIWGYKTTRESFERIERKTTQLTVDERILKILNRSSKGSHKSYQKLVDEFEQYIFNKGKEERNQKFIDGKSNLYQPQYLYLKNRLSAIEEVIKHFLGKPELRKIEKMYEAEFTERILHAKEH